MTANTPKPDTEATPTAQALTRRDVAGALAEALEQARVREFHPEAFEPWEGLVERWLRSPDIRSPTSRRQHVSNLKRHVLPRLSAPCPGACALEDLEGLGAWCLDRERSSGLKAATRHSAGSTARKLLRYAAELRYLPFEPDQVERAIPLPRIDDTAETHILSPEQLAQLFAACQDSRERAILALLGLVGLRRSEVAALAIDGIGERTLSVQRAKGGKRRTVPLAPSVRELLLAYLEATRRHLGSRGPLFLPAGNRRSASGQLSNRSVARILHTIAQRAHLERVRPHALRHSFAVAFLEHNGEGALHQLQAILGHASIATTGRYLAHVRTEQLAERMPAVPG